MKPSHRKDVIIARIIFAALCIALIAIIVSVVMAITAHFGKNKKDMNTETTQTESQTEDVYEDVPVVTPEQVEETPKVLVKTTASVNLRMEADKSSEIHAVIPKGTELLVISEENGWANVEYAGYVGYVHMDYIEEVPMETPNSEAGEKSVTTVENALE